MLAVARDEHESFASLQSILGQVARAGFGHETGRREIDQLLELAVHGRGPTAAPPQARLLADSVAFAILRRISRESVYTARLIDTAARFLNSSCAASGVSEVHIPHADRIDRPTLKVLARATLLLSPADRFAWVWHSEVDPRAPAAGDSLFALSRQSLLNTIVSVIDPRIEAACARPLHVPAGRSDRALDDVTVALVLQNYDACFAWTTDLVDDGDSAARVEAARLRALAAINVGQLEPALRLLHDAEEQAPEAATRAHLAYLQGLTEAKRVYRLDASDGHYARGMQSLRARGSERSGDLPLEEAWLLNGIALNTSIRGRRSEDPTNEYQKAFDLVQRAFSLVREGSSPARSYLRSNLIANSALLLEMSGRSAQAVGVLKEAFERAPEDMTQETSRLLLNLAYRIGTLELKAGHFQEARRLFAQVADGPAAAESWSLRERIFRAMGFGALLVGDLADAETAFREGLDLCRRHRSAGGTLEHGRGLVAAFAGKGLSAEARDIAETLLRDEGIDVAEGPDGARIPLEEVEPSVPSPKLPAYLPEIDLEGIPRVDLNRFLTGAGMDGGSSAGAWTA